jgi:pimeloyl-ACP methyl ester carboxylesterase
MNRNGREQKMDNLSSQIAVISGGEIEYTLAGKGPAVLVSHGTLGGYDQALAISGLFNREAFSFLAVSRAGYLRSSPATGLTPEDQARSYVELLDHLGLSNAAVMGISGGAPPAITFARDYPDRCRALVLVSSITAAPPPLPLFFRLAVRLQDITMRIDPLWALVYKFGLGLLLRSNGLKPDQVKQVLGDPHLRAVAQGIYRPIKTASARREGVRLDGIQVESLPVEANYPLGVPTFICHAANDPLASPQTAARLASSIPEAEYLELADGGHLFFVIHSEQVVPAIERFLSRILDGS